MVGAWQSLLLAGSHPGTLLQQQSEEEEMEVGLLAVDGRALMVAVQAAGGEASRARMAGKSLGNGGKK